MKGCGCCEGVHVATPEPGGNRPGLGQLSYRAGTYSTFLDSMVARLSSLSLEVPTPPGSAALTTIRPLARLTTRERDDAAIALLDAWAIVADVMTFYQERIANEGYLGTALERRSLVELARLIGYRPRPGVSASVHLAFDAALGFSGTIPKGTRAQSIPGTGESAQYFETSDDLTAREAWNLLAPRVTRPQLITPPRVVVRGDQELPLVTGADVVDAIYLRGTSTNLKPGDALLFVFNSEVELQFLRRIEAVNIQGPHDRTEIVLQPLLPSEAVSAVALLLPFVEKATYLFPGNELTQDVAATLTRLLDNVQASGEATRAAHLVRGAISEVLEKRDVAVRRDFSRVAAWADHVLRALQHVLSFAVQGTLEELDGDGGGDDDVAMIFAPSTLAASPLGKLAAMVDRLALPASAQPANSKRLPRTLAQSFAAESDNAPRLLAALKPRAARKLYPAWAAVETPGNRVELHVPRVKASLFAHNFPGRPTVLDGTTTYTAPTLLNAWGIERDEPAPFVALDGAYDQIKPGSWVVIDRPDVRDSNKAEIPGKRTYHRVTALKTATLEAGADSGFAAKVSVLTLHPPWLDDLAFDAKSLNFVIGSSTQALRGTVVYSQTEPLELVEEPVDTDVQGSSLQLARAYDGLEAGRWLIVSGERTDIPNVRGVTDNELVMIAGVAQSAEPPLSVGFPLTAPPFSEVFYTTGANQYGDRLVVGTLVNEALLSKPVGGAVIPNEGEVPMPEFANQQYREQVQLAPGFYANAYVPTAPERLGQFPDFAGLLVDPLDGKPFIAGNITRALEERSLFAWRITSRPAETVLTLAAPLAYRYDTRSIKIFGNVTVATHGQTTGEVLGDGDAGTAFQSFALRQGPLTHVSAPTPAGAESTLDVRVNEVRWHESQSLAPLGPRDRAFTTEGRDDGTLRATFGNGEHGARLPTGRGNIKATYRHGIGKGGNVKAWQISQLATHPLGLKGVQNPLPASGGADRDSENELRRNAPIAVMALDRLVSVDDYAAFARNYAGIGKASARRLSDGRRQLVHLTIAGKDDIPIDRTSDLYRNLGESLARFGDPMSSVAVCVRRSRLLVISAGVALMPDYLWEAVEPRVRAAVLDVFAFDRRELEQAAFLSEAIAAMQGVEGVSHVNVERFDSVPEGVTASELASLAKTLGSKHFVAAEAASLNPRAPSSADVCDRVLAAELVFLTPEVPDTLLLKVIGA